MSKKHGFFDMSKIKKMIEESNQRQSFIARMVAMEYDVHEVSPEDRKECIKNNRKFFEKYIKPKLKR
jgi:hypothetical protein